MASKRENEGSESEENNKTELGESSVCFLQSLFCVYASATLTAKSRVSGFEGGREEGIFLKFLANYAAKTAF